MSEPLPKNGSAATLALNSELTLPKVLGWAKDFLRNHQLDEAQAMYDMVLAELPKQPDALHYMGVIKHQRGDSDSALSMMRQSIKLMPQEAWPLNNLGNVLYDLKRYDEALDAYKRCASIDDRHAEAFANIAGLLLRSKQLIDAERASRRAIELSSDFARPHYLLSQILIRQGKVEEGLMVNANAQKIGLKDKDSRLRICHTLIALGHQAEAAKLYQEWLELEPNNPVVKHHLAALTKEQVPNRASDDYVQEVFDGFAASFDTKLASLGYKAPQIVVARLATILPKSPTLQIADLGCGTGLCGPLVRPWAKRLIGCDLSVGMLEKARPRGCYDELVQNELGVFLLARPASFNLLISADTLCYLGDLTEVASAASASLLPGGSFIFTVEATEEETAQGFVLQSHGRYAHNADHLRRTFLARGFASAHFEKHILRMEKDEPVHGWLVDCAVH